MIRPKCLVVPAGVLQEQLFPPSVREHLDQLADVVYNDEEELSSSDLAAMLPGHRAAITAWGTPKLTREVLDAAEHLAVVAHAAGSVRFMLPDPPEEFFRRGLRITSATRIMSRYVAELSLCLAIACLRRLPRFREDMKQSDLWWGTHSDLDPDTLVEQRVGIVGLGSISWELVRLLEPFGCEIWGYSRHMDAEATAASGVQLVGLQELLSNCPIIFLLAAVRPDTTKLIDRERLKLIRDGSVIINTARGALVDEEALIEELQSGRLWAGLDVTEPEPPAADSPLRTLPNVLLTPPVGGPVPSRYWEMGAFIVEELGRFFLGQELQGEITERRLEGIA